MNFLDKLKKQKDLSRSEVLEQLVREKMQPQPPPPLTEEEAVLKN
ncbi:hypothetical protein [Okeania sp. SIO3B5]